MRQKSSLLIIYFFAIAMWTASSKYISILFPVLENIMFQQPLWNLSSELNSEVGYEKSNNIEVIMSMNQICLCAVVVFCFYVTFVKYYWSKLLLPFIIRQWAMYKKKKKNMWVYGCLPWVLNFCVKAQKMSIGIRNCLKQEKSKKTD